MKILFVTSEVSGFFTSGGLGDVSACLPRSIKKIEGADIRVFVPLYSALNPDIKADLKKEAEFEVTLSWRKLYAGIYSLTKQGVTYYFLDNEYYFKRNKLYGEYDDGERFAYFSLAVVSAMKVIGFYPDILHANDWQTALTIIYLRRLFHYDDIKTVFTVHNLEYQGKFSLDILGDVFNLNNEDRWAVEYDGCINLLKGAIELSDRVTTVSPTYSKEILHDSNAHLLGEVLRRNSGKIRGILNGIDMKLFNPEDDPLIAENYSSKSLQGKVVCKKCLQKEVGLSISDAPLFTVISRLVNHKGIDLIVGSIEELLKNNDMQFILLGSGEEDYHSFFDYLQRRFSDKVRVFFGFDSHLAKKIYSAGDFFLMPSKSEPCGLAQMIASRYGNVPIVRETGGLYDTIQPFWIDNGKMMGNGFTFAGYSAYELKERSEAAIKLYYDKELFNKLRVRIMERDFSFDDSADKYYSLYKEIKGEK